MRTTLLFILAVTLVGFTGCEPTQAYKDMTPLPERRGDQDSWPSGSAPYAKSIVSKTTGMKLTLIPAGEFMMGSPESEKDRLKLEAQHKVKLTKSYYMGVTEVTQGQWFSVMGTRPWEGKTYVKEGANYPATHVSWEDAVDFCKRLSQKDGVPYRLPTEAEWEYACRGGSQTAYSFGDSAVSLKDYAWFDANASDVDEEYAHEVGKKRGNSFGLFDMHGNVWEWCSDWYDGDYYESSTLEDPKGPSSGSYRVFRGGSWYYSPLYCRSAIRYGYAPSNRFSDLGFRVCSSVK
jgi:sulfatase modifying factor 1